MITLQIDLIISLVVGVAGIIATWYFSRRYYLSRTLRQAKPVTAEDIQFESAKYEYRLNLSIVIAIAILVALLFILIFLNSILKPDSIPIEPTPSQTPQFQTLIMS